MDIPRSANSTPQRPMNEMKTWSSGKRKKMYAQVFEQKKSPSSHQKTEKISYNCQTPEPQFQDVRKKNCGKTVEIALFSLYHFATVSITAEISGYSKFY